jgi:hypothetical protein
MYHELQIHRRQYVCKDCGEVYTNRNEISTHLQAHYGKSISPAQLSVMLDLCNLQVDVLEKKQDSCLLCGKELLLSALQEHLATHMEDLALFVLPNVHKEETDDSKASLKGTKLDLNDKCKDTKSELSSLGFSEADGHGLSLADFKNLQTSEEPGYDSKFTLWSTIEQHNLSAIPSRSEPLFKNDSPYVEADAGDGPIGFVNPHVGGQSSEFSLNPDLSFTEYQSSEQRKRSQWQSSSGFSIIGEDTGSVAELSSRTRNSPIATSSDLAQQHQDHAFDKIPTQQSLPTIGEALRHDTVTDESKSAGFTALTAHQKLFIKPCFNFSRWKRRV